MQITKQHLWFFNDAYPPHDYFIGYFDDKGFHYTTYVHRKHDSFINPINDKPVNGKLVAWTLLPILTPEDIPLKEVERRKTIYYSMETPPKETMRTYLVIDTHGSSTTAYFSAERKWSIPVKAWAYFPGEKNNV